MDQTQLKRVSRPGGVSAQIISDGCREYLIEIGRKATTSPLCNSGRSPMRFKSLDEVNASLNRYNVFNRFLAVRIADDEVGQPSSASATLNAVPLEKRVN